MDELLTVPIKPQRDRSTEAHNKVTGLDISNQLSRLTRHGDALKMLTREYDFVHEVTQSFDRFLVPANVSKNRFSNLVLFDNTRVSNYNIC